MTEAPGGSSSGPSRMGRAKQQSTAVTSSPLQPTVPRTARATVAFTAGTNEGSSDRSKSGTKPLQKQKSLASTSKEGSLSYVHTLKEGERKGGWIKISGPPFLVKEADVLSLQEVFNDIQGAAGEGVVTLQAFRRYVGSKVSSGKDDSRERAKQLSADLYRVLDTQGKDSVDFIDIVRVMHPELSKKDLAIVCAAVMPLRDVRVLDEMERRDITRTFQEKTFKSEGRLPLYQVLGLASHSNSTGAISGPCVSHVILCWMVALCNQCSVSSPLRASINADTMRVAAGAGYCPRQNLPEQNVEDQCTGAPAGVHGQRRRHTGGLLRHGGKGGGASARDRGCDLPGGALTTWCHSLAGDFRAMYWRHISSGILTLPDYGMFAGALGTPHGRAGGEIRHQPCHPGGGQDEVRTAKQS